MLDTLATDIAELVRLFPTKGIEAADDPARALINTRNMGRDNTAALLGGFAGVAYGQ